MQPINLIWLQGQGCTGDTVSLISARDPSLVDVLTGILPEVSDIKLAYHPTVMAPWGETALGALDDAKEGNLDPFVLVLEGAIPDEDEAAKDGESHVLEAGPLARMWIAAMAGKVPESTGDSVRFVLPAGAVAGRRVPQELPMEWKIPGSINALERVRARAYFHAFSAYAAYKAFASALDLLNKGETKVWNRYRRPRHGIGVGMTEAMRGAVAHWCVMRRGKIRRYQITTPTGWNVSPRDHLGRPGPYEQAIIDTPITEQGAGGKLDGIDVVRAVRSFDPCLACTVHVYSPVGNKLATRELEHVH